MDQFDVVVIGAGAAGMMCAIEAGKRGRSVLIIDHAEAPGEKIRISGGGRCNFTNVNASPEQFLSENPRFCIVATAQRLVPELSSRDKPFYGFFLYSCFPACLQSVLRPES